MVQDSCHSLPWSPPIATSISLTVPSQAILWITVFDLRALKSKQNVHSVKGGCRLRQGWVWEDLAIKLSRHSTTQIQHRPPETEESIFPFPGTSRPRLGWIPSTHLCDVSPELTPGAVLSEASHSRQDGLCRDFYGTAERSSSSEPPSLRA